jgi:hypothetical protein
MANKTSNTLPLNLKSVAVQKANQIAKARTWFCFPKCLNKKIEIVVAKVMKAVIHVILLEIVPKCVSVQSHRLGKLRQCDFPF